MKISGDFQNSLHKVLKNLIEQKSIRDKSNFTAYQLAKELSIPRSLITNLTHADESKRVNNPRISTLLKIIDYFKSDGFNITLEDLLGLNTNYIDIASQALNHSEHSVTIPVYSLSDSSLNHQMGSATISLSNPTNNLVGFIASTDLSSVFKAGSIFIVDRDLAPESENLIAVALDNYKIQIRKYVKNNNKIILESLNNNENAVIMPTTQIEIIGVVIQVNAKT